MKKNWLFGACALGLTLASPTLAGVAPDGADFQANVRSDYMQVNSVSAFAADGSAAIAWENDQRGIRANLRGTEVDLVLNQGVPNGQGEGTEICRRDPSLVFLPNGQFLLAWTEERAYVRIEAFREERDIQAEDIWVGRFGADGKALGLPLRVSGSTAAMHAVPKLALRPGGAVVVWQESPGHAGSGPIAARLLDAAGRPTGAELRLTEDATAQHAAVAVGKAGQILVAWDAVVGGAEDVFARLVAARGTTSGAAFRVHSASAGRQRWPAISTGASGQFLVAWQGYLVDRSLARIKGRLLDAQARFASPEFGISADQGTAHLAPAVATAAHGYAATWLAWSDRGLGVKGVALNASGMPVGAEFWVKDGVVIKNYRRTLAASAAGELLTTWEQVSRSGQRNIGARRLASN